MKKDVLVVYLSGSIRKSRSASDNKLYWGKEEIAELKEGAKKLNKQLIILDPSNRTDDIGDEVSVLGRDLLMVLISDAVIVDGRQKRGAGVGAEMAYAETQGIPIISVIPPGTDNHQYNAKVLDQEVAEYKHPFIHGLANHVETTFKKAGLKLAQEATARNEFFIQPVTEKILDAMQHYISTQLEKDKPMKQAYLTYPQVKERVRAIATLTMEDMKLPHLRRSLSADIQELLDGDSTTLDDWRQKKPDIELQFKVAEDLRKLWEEDDVPGNDDEGYGKVDTLSAEGISPPL